MKLLFPRKLFCMLILGIIFLILASGCGKKAGDKESSSGETVRRPVESEIDEFLNKQELLCEEGQVCPSYISKMVVIHGSSMKICTGFAVSSTVLATSASCIPRNLREQGLNCEKDIFVFFPGVTSRQPERVKCKQVLQVSDLSHSDLIYWRDDVSFLEIERPGPRRYAKINRDGLQDHKDFTAWGIDQVDEHIGFIRKQSCEAVHKNWINPLASNESSPNMVMANCIFKEGSSGSPILDSKGRVRGVVSRPVDKDDLEYLKKSGLLLQPLRDMLHATNFACAQALEDIEVLDEKECSKDLSLSIFTAMRSEMLTLKANLKEIKEKLETKISDANKYLNFSVSFNFETDIYKAIILPKCFKTIKNWINTVNTSRNAFVFQHPIPVIGYRRKIDSYGRVQAVEEIEDPINYFFQFSPKSIFNQKNSNVLVWEEGEPYTTYSSLSESCQ